MSIRLFDLFFGFLLFLLFLPFLLIIALCIKVSDLKSPVFVDKHLRVGKGGNLFRMYKFRTMKPGSHDMMLKDPGLIKKKREGRGKISMKDDPRVTSMGKIIRKLDLDESPQIFNVLKGDMSLIGPRPYLKEEVDEYKETYDIFNKRIDDVLKIKPGMTGLWQISGRNLLNPGKRVECDYEYFKKRGLLFNLLILLKTPYVVLTRYGAKD